MCEREDNKYFWEYFSLIFTTEDNEQHNQHFILNCSSCWMMFQLNLLSFSPNLNFHYRNLDTTFKWNCVLPNFFFLLWGSFQILSSLWISILINFFKLLLLWLLLLWRVGGPRVPSLNVEYLPPVNLLSNSFFQSDLIELRMPIKEGTKRSYSEGKHFCLFVCLFVKFFVLLIWHFVWLF
jgi:hypothetical protein